MSDGTGRIRSALRASRAIVPSGASFRRFYPPTFWTELQSLFTPETRVRSNDEGLGGDTLKPRPRSGAPDAELCREPPEHMSDPLPVLSGPRTGQITKPGMISSSLAVRPSWTSVGHPK